VHSVFSDLILAAKTKVLADRDSVSKRKQENIFLTQVSEIRRDRLLLSQELQQKRLEARKNSDVKLAYDKLVAIYIYIEKDSIKQARNYYQNVKKLLENNLLKQDLIKLDSALNSVSTPLNTSEKIQ
jgi:hypothetical protein